MSRFKECLISCFVFFFSFATKVQALDDNQPDVDTTRAETIELLEVIQKSKRVTRKLDYGREIAAFEK
jgi:hypothetical protein